MEKTSNYHAMEYFKSIMILSLILILFYPITSFADATDHARWCFNEKTNSKLFEKPMDRGTCRALLQGGLLASYFSGDPSISNLVLNKRENELARHAASFACRRNVKDDQIAIRLIQVCQCHNTGAQREIENDQSRVLEVLRQIGGCSETLPPPPPVLPPSTPLSTSKGSPSPSGCFYDTQCKGDRICESGRCVSPK